MRFEELDLSDSLLDALFYMGFDQATPIQEKAIPEILRGRDMIACAQTGTGKTAAFMLPILDKLASRKAGEKGTSVLVVVPTRELAIQIEHQIQGFAYFIPVTSYAIYGGVDAQDWDKQRNALQKGTDIIVATPGKLLSHLQLGIAKLEKVQHLILDEADRMLDMGFHADIQRIVSYLPEKRQNLMFSATMPPKIRQLASQTLKDPVTITLELSKPAEGVTQSAYLAFEEQKGKLLKHIIKQRPEDTSILVFSSMKSKISEIVRLLKGQDYSVEGISSDLEQKEREEVLQRFRSRKTRVLVATDVLSRGIDIKDINLVVNFDVPGDAEDYVHRVGRTARADTKGAAITFVSPNDMFRFKKIEELIDMTVPKAEMPEALGEAPAWDPKPFKRPSGGGGGRPSGGRGGASGKGPKGPRDGQKSGGERNKGPRPPRKPKPPQA